MIRFFTPAIFLFLSLVARGEANPWSAVVKGIEGNLGGVIKAYSEGDHRLAKSYLTDAYFLLFEGKGMESAIRTNISAKRAYEIESLFGDIRKAINRKAPTSELESLIGELKEVLREDAERLYRMGALPEEVK